MQAAVQHNNDLAAAKGLASTAEEKVLWKLTSAVSETSADIQAALHAVSRCLLLVVHCLHASGLGLTKCRGQSPPWACTSVSGTQSVLKSIWATGALDSNA